MSYGTRTNDARKNTPFLVGGLTNYVMVGPYFSKTWNGGDAIVKRTRPSLPPRPTFDPLVKPPFNAVTKRQKDERLAFINESKNRAKLVKAWSVSTEDQRAAIKKQQRPLHSKKVAKRIRVLPPNSYTMSLTRACYGAYVVRKYSDPGYQALTGCSVVIGGHIPLNAQDHYKMIDRLRNKVYGSGFHPGIFAAEAPKALKMIGNAATQLRLAMTAFADRNWRGVVRNLGEPTSSLYGRARYSWLSYTEGRMSISKAWLAFSYGWKPLVKDLEDGAAYVAFMLNDPGTVASGRVKTTKSFEKEEKLPNTYSGVRFTKRKTTHKVSYLITELKASSRTLPSLPAVAAVAWEKLPYSFVCDWVAPIGGYLQALRTASDLKGAKVVVSVLSETTWSEKELYKTLGVTHFVPLTPDLTESLQLVTFTRNISDSISPPVPEGDLRPSSIFKHWSRAANAVALLQKLKFPAKAK